MPGPERSLAYRSYPHHHLGLVHVWMETVRMGPSNAYYHTFLGILPDSALENHSSQIAPFIRILTVQGSPQLSPHPLGLAAPGLCGLNFFWGTMVVGKLTHGSIEGGVQVRDKHLRVDIVQVPGKVVAV